MKLPQRIHKSALAGKVAALHSAHEETQQSLRKHADDHMAAIESARLKMEENQAISDGVARSNP